MPLRTFAATRSALGLLISFALLTTTIHGQNNTTRIRNIVLVHGAWADGSSWSKLVPILQAEGLHVVCVQNPLTSLADDVAATNRIIDAQDGPVLLVGHSYGGAVLDSAAK